MGVYEYMIERAMMPGRGEEVEPDDSALPALRQHLPMNRVASHLSGFGIMGFEPPATAKNSALPKCSPSRRCWVNQHLIALDTRRRTLNSREMKAAGECGGQ